MIQLPVYIWIGFGIGTFMSIASSLMACWVTYIRSNRKLIKATNRSIVFLFAILFHLFKIVTFALKSLLPQDTLDSRSFAPLNTMMMFLILSIPTIAIFMGFQAVIHVATRRLVLFKNLYYLLFVHSALCCLVLVLNMALHNGEKIWEIYYGMAYVSVFVLVWIPTTGLIALYFCKDY